MSADLEAPSFVVTELELEPRETEIGVSRVFMVARGVCRVCWMETPDGLVGTCTQVRATVGMAELHARNGAYGRMVMLIGKRIAQAQRKVEAAE